MFDMPASHVPPDKYETCTHALAANWYRRRYNNNIANNHFERFYFHIYSSEPPHISHEPSFDVSAACTLHSAFSSIFLANSPSNNSTELRINKRNRSYLYQRLRPTCSFMQCTFIIKSSSAHCGSVFANISSISTLWIITLVWKLMVRPFVCMQNH